MTIADRWLLPDGMEEVLPPQARQIEELRRELLDLFHTWGYDLVFPPPAEYLESLLTGSGNDLDLQTFKVTDQMTGRMMGIAADITPQVARMDAHSMKRQGPARFCYCANVLRTKAGSMLGSRSPMQVGAELFGDDGLESDTEILGLMISALATAGAGKVYLDMGHVGIYRALIREADLTADQEKTLFDAILHKAYGEIDQIVARDIANESVRGMISRLARLNGGADILAQAQVELADAPASVKEALNSLEQIANVIKNQYPNVEINFDLAELRGYNYHTGMVFAAYIPGYSHAVAQGGRYDETGKVFGRARPATGFSADLKILAKLLQKNDPVSGVFAPAGYSDDQELLSTIRALRSEGTRVVNGLPDQDVSALEMGCDSELVLKEDGQWVVEPINRIF
ncbi:ATP phosphoribosyltransferase regulatory subunit [Oceanospirillum sanctuarii]|uniref:ATP phosphoribosyltransferase regulatory subunit n=1 Tax=Oceanospirillum sanctuarii TaxID=1434821 RepID=UPI000A376505|nr:ATP phosphoribosyltransferase regulatory subunit [Oceanospirillum sanctuarii]